MKKIFRMPPPIAILMGLCALLMFAACDSSGESDADVSDSDNDVVDTAGGIDYSAFLDYAIISATTWDVWGDFNIEFTLDEDANVTVGVTGTLANGSYCDLDDIKLYSSDDENTNLISNGDFETNGGSYEGWTASVSSGDTDGDCEATTDQWASNNKTNFLHLSNYDNGMDMTATVTQTVELQAGSYKATIQVAGETGSSELVFFAEIAEADE